ncbi:hypothetical protein ALC53_01930, partial [Atta colombica]
KILGGNIQISGSSTSHFSDFYVDILRKPPWRKGRKEDGELERMTKRAGRRKKRKILSHAS